jgi:hypothetical protein
MFGLWGIMLGTYSKQSSQVKMFESHVKIFYGKMPLTILCEIYQILGYEIILYVWFGAQNEPTPTNTPWRMDDTWHEETILGWVLVSYHIMVLTFNHFHPQLNGKGHLVDGELVGVGSF